MNQVRREKLKQTLRISHKKGGDRGKTITTGGQLEKGAAHSSETWRGKEGERHHESTADQRLTLSSVLKGKINRKGRNRESGK